MLCDRGIITAKLYATRILNGDRVSRKQWVLRVSNGLVEDDGRVVESEGENTSGALLEARQGLAIAVRIPPPNE